LSDSPRRQISTNKVVAIKVLDIDEADFHAYGEQKDEQIRDFQREIRILRQAQESSAENLNRLIDALPVHSQLWMICEYCPGGSVKTLVSAFNHWISRLRRDRELWHWTPVCDSTRVHFLFLFQQDIVSRLSLTRLCLDECHK
jgi:serine/threonine protein kinase